MSAMQFDCVVARKGKVLCIRRWRMVGGLSGHTDDGVNVINADGRGSCKMRNVILCLCTQEEEARARQQGMGTQNVLHGGTCCVGDRANGKCEVHRADPVRKLFGGIGEDATGDEGMLPQ